MKSLKTHLLASGYIFGALLTGAAQPAPTPAGNGPAMQINTNAPEGPDQAVPPQEGAMPPGDTAPNGSPAADQETPAMPAEAPADATTGTNEAPAQYVPPPGPQTGGGTTSLSPVPDQSAAGGENELRLDFRNAPLEMVLNYLSDAAGFIIELDTPVHGRVDVWSNRPVTKDEAVDLLNSVLNKNGYAAIRNGRTLEIMEKHTAVTSNIPVRTGNEPAEVPNNDEIVTQIVPIRYVQAAQLVTDLSPLIAPQAIVANEAGNSIIITDTQANIKHAVEIIKAIDSSAEDVTEVRVFHLRYADVNDMATLLAGLFPDQSGNGAQTPFRFGGGGGRFGGFGGFGGFPGFGGFGGGGGGRGGGGGGGNASTSNSNADRIKKRAQVIAVPDPRTSSIVVTASNDLMDQIAAMIQQLDVDSAKVQHVHVFHLDNADAQEVMPVLQSMFQKNNTSAAGNSSTQTSPLMSRTQQNESSSSSTSSTSSGFGSSNSRGLGGSSSPQF